MKRNLIPLWTAILVLSGMFLIGQDTWPPPPPEGMVKIEGGCFEMGDHFSEGDLDERPVHEVCISTFDMDIHEVTNAAYADCVDEGGCTAPNELGSNTRDTYYGDPAWDEFPVIYVKWTQAQEFCAWKNRRLPTEAEWEYAARGGLSAKRYPWGDTISGTDANYKNSGDPWDNDTSEAGYYPANGYGLYDMAGNVREYVNDWYQEDYYDVSPTNDPQGPASGSSRVLRDGGWNNDPPGHLRVASRTDVNPDNYHENVGFRCAHTGAY